MPLRGGVENGIDDLVVEQVHLVDVEQVVVGAGEDAAFEADAVLLNGDALVDAADDIFQPSVERQFDQPDRFVMRDRLPRLKFLVAVGVEDGGVRAVPCRAGSAPSSQSLTSTSGRIPFRLRTAVVLPVPRGPISSTPPTAGLITDSSRAMRISN